MLQTLLEGLTGQDLTTQFLVHRLLFVPIVAQPHTDPLAEAKGKDNGQDRANAVQGVLLRLRDSIIVEETLCYEVVDIVE